MDVFGPIAVIITKAGDKIAIVRQLEAEELESLGIFSEIILISNEIQSPIADIVRKYDPSTIALNYSEKDYTADGLTLLRGTGF